MASAEKEQTVTKRRSSKKPASAMTAMRSDMEGNVEAAADMTNALSAKEEKEIVRRLSHRRKRKSMRHLLSNSKSMKEINPFQCDDRIDPESQTQFILGCIFLVPLRICAIVLTLLLTSVLLSLSVIGLDLRKPLPDNVNTFQKFVGVTASRILCACFGIYDINIKGKRATPEECKMIVLGPHSTVMDAVVLGAVGGGTGVAKGELRNTILGPSMKAGQTIFVERDDSKNKSRVANMIRERVARNGPWKKQVAMFPEGTCTNRTSLINFRLGAFNPGEPVQPVVLSWEYTDFDPSWTAGSRNRGLIVLRSLARWSIGVTVEFLPVHHPTEEEKENAVVFASNVRQSMADALGVPTSEFSYSDMFLCKAIAKSGVSPALVLPFTFASLQNEMSEYKVSKNDLFEDTKALLKMYCKVPKLTEQARLNKKEFEKLADNAARVLEIEVENKLEWEKFEQDARSDGTISFRDFLTIHLHYKYSNQ